MNSKLKLLLLLTLLLAVPSVAQQPIIFHPPLPKIKVTSPFGVRVHPITRKPAFHSGVDLAARASPVYAILAGRVLRTGSDPLLGNYVTLNCSGLQITYGHLSRILVSGGELLYAGKCIGVTGSTGRVTGEHLHLSVQYGGKYFCPITFMRQLRSQAGFTLAVNTPNL